MPKTAFLKFKMFEATSQIAIANYNRTFARAIHHYRLPTQRLARHPIAVFVKSREPALLKVEPGFRA
jgi:hypothetical protein